MLGSRNYLTERKIVLKNWPKTGLLPGSVIFSSLIQIIPYLTQFECKNSVLSTNMNLKFALLCFFWAEFLHQFAHVHASLQDVPAL